MYEGRKKKIKKSPLEQFTGYLSEIDNAEVKENKSTGHTA